MMGLTEGDKAIVAKVAAELIEVVVPKMIEAHKTSCPTTSKVVFAKGAAWMLGAILTSSLLSAIIALIVANMKKG